MHRARSARNRTPITTTGMIMSRSVWWLNPPELAAAAAAAVVDVAAGPALVVEARAEAGVVEEAEGADCVATAVSITVTAPPATEMNTLSGFPVVSCPRTRVAAANAMAATM